MTSFPNYQNDRFNKQNSAVDNDYENFSDSPQTSPENEQQKVENGQNYSTADTNINYAQANTFDSLEYHAVKEIPNLDEQKRLEDSMTQMNTTHQITNNDVLSHQVDNPKDLNKNKQNDSGISSLIWTILMALTLAIFVAGMGGVAGFYFADKRFQDTVLKTQVTSEIMTTKTVEQESETINVAKNSRDSVVSVIISKKLVNSSRNNRSTSNKSTQVGAGSGFIVSKEGYIVTNRHVVEDTEAEFTVAFDDKTRFPAKVLARDTLLDIAIIKVETEVELKPIPLGDSSKIQVGQTVIAIGNSLGEFSNTVSKGIISGLGRTITASDESNTSSEVLEDIIQTDASINPGNSGGPLLDIDGNVIGVNVARAQSGENIGFTLPINSVKFVLESVINTGKIERPFLGVSYIELTPEIAKEQNLNSQYGAFVNGESQDKAVISGSAADKAGVKLGDIILQISGQKIDTTNTLRKTIQKFKVGDKITLKILRDSKEIELSTVLMSIK